MNSTPNVTITKTERIYNGFLKMDKITFNQERFDGSTMDNVIREVAVRGNVVFLALYDPKADKHLFVEQVRVGAIVNNVESPMVLEPVAGVIDGDEDAIVAAIREAEEESGVGHCIDMDSLTLVHQGYTSPSGSSEFQFFFTGYFDSSQYEEQIGGVEGENEDIRSHLISSDSAMDMIASGEINSLTGAFGVYWHKAHS